MTDESDDSETQSQRRNIETLFAAFRSRKPLVSTAEYASVGDTYFSFARILHALGPETYSSLGVVMESAKSCLEGFFEQSTEGFSQHLNYLFDRARDSYTRAFELDPEANPRRLELLSDFQKRIQ